MYAITTGCSHTAGNGNRIEDCYTSILEKHYRFSIINKGINGGNCHTTLQVIVDTLSQSDLPKFIIAQWPNPFRMTLWADQKMLLENIMQHGLAFAELLKNGNENFYEPWTRSIIVANLLCKLIHIPIINIFLDEIDKQNLEYFERIKKHDIILHVDEKKPGHTWLFDNNADDGVHHSFWCHHQWAERMIGLIDEIT